MSDNEELDSNSSETNADSFIYRYTNSLEGNQNEERDDIDERSKLLNQNNNGTKLRSEFKSDKNFRPFSFLDQTEWRKFGDLNEKTERKKKMAVNILKSWIAFLLSSLLTFIPSIQTKLGYSSHFATVAVLLFHPGKSVGAMFETVVLALLGTSFAGFVCIIGDVLVRYLEPVNYFSLFSAILMLLLLFTSTFILSYIRAKYDRVPVYTAAIMSNIILIVHLTNGSIHKLNDQKPNSGYLRWNWILQNSLIVPILAGVAVSLVTNITIFPKSARSEVRTSIHRSLNSVKNLLDQMVDTFLLTPSNDTLSNFSSQDSILSISSPSDFLKSLMQKHQRLLTNTLKAHKESRLELFSVGNNKYDLFSTFLESMNRLTQHISGMKSSILKQEKWLTASDDPVPKESSSTYGKNEQQKAIEILYIFLESVGQGLRSLNTKCQDVLTELNDLVEIQHNFESRIFKTFRSIPIEESERIISRIDALQVSLSAALEEFNRMQKRQLMLLYEDEKFDGTPKDEAFLVYYFVFCMIEFTKEIKNGLLGSLKEFFDQAAAITAKRPYLGSLDEDSNLGLNTDSTANQRPKTSSFVKLRTFQSRNINRNYDSKFYHYFKTQTDGAFHNYIKSPAIQSNFHNLTSGRKSMVPNGRGFTHIKSSMRSSSATLRYRLKLWKFLSELGNSFRLKFGFKTAFVVTFLATFAFIPKTELVYKDYRGQWALISAAMIMTHTVGGSNLAGLYRVLGTAVGALYSYFSWIMFPNNALGLLMMISIFSIPCFYVLIASNYPKVARITLIAVSAIVLANYSNIDNPDWHYSIMDLAWERGIMVIIGMVIGLFVTWYVWPYEARVELRKNLSDMLLNMGILYSRLVEVFISNPAAGDKSFSSSNDYEKKIKLIAGAPISLSNFHNYYYAQFDCLSDKETQVYFMTFETLLNMKLMELNQLIPLTWLEPRLKGPFPIEMYKKMLECCQNILDKFVAMRVAISNNLETIGNTDQHEKNANHNIPYEVIDESLEKEDKFFESLGRKLTSASFRQDDLILGLVPRPSFSPSSSFIDGSKSTNNTNIDSIVSQLPELLPLRRELVGSVLLCFYIYAGALILKQPLPTYLPPAYESRERLLKKLREVIKQAVSEEKEKKPKPLQGDNTNDYRATTIPRMHSRAQSMTPSHLTTPQKFINYYAYSLAMEDVIDELNQLGGMLKNLFGEMFADVVHFKQPYDYEHVAEDDAFLENHSVFDVENIVE